MRSIVAGFNRAMRLGLWLSIFAGVALSVSGDFQTRLMFEQQPMKMAAAEALCETETGPGLSVFAIGDVSQECDVRSLVIPGLLSFLATDTWDAEIPGVIDVQADFEEQFGPGDYRPNLVITYWSFRAMIGIGMVSVMGAAATLIYLRFKKTLPMNKWAGRARDRGDHHTVPRQPVRLAVHRDGTPTLGGGPQPGRHPRDPAPHRRRGVRFGRRQPRASRWSRSHWSTAGSASSSCCCSASTSTPAPTQR